MVVSDPYIETLSGGWKPASPEFRFSGWLRGYLVAPVTVGSDDDLLDILSANADVFDIFIVSPYHAGSFPVTELEGKRVIVAGGYPPDGRDDFEYVVPDRTGAFAEAGVAAAEGEYSRIVLLVDLTTPAGTREFGAFMESYGSSGGSPENLQIIDLAGKPAGELPQEFSDASGEADLLLLLAGPGNYQAYLSSEENAVPVITEKSKVAGMKKERIIGSIEDNPRAFGRALMDKIADSGDVKEKTYPIRLFRR